MFLLRLWFEFRCWVSKTPFICRAKRNSHQHSKRVKLCYSHLTCFIKLIYIIISLVCIYALVQSLFYSITWHKNILVQIFIWYKGAWQSSFLMPTLIAYQWNLTAFDFQIDIISLNAQREAPTYRSWRKQALPRSAPAQVFLPVLQIQVLLCDPSGCRAGPGPAAALSWAARTVPDLPRGPLPAREVHLRLLYLSSLRSPVGFHASQNQLSCWISKAVFASSLCVCVFGEGAVPAAQGHLHSLSLKEWRANNSNNLAERTTNSLCQVNFAFPLQLNFFSLLLHNESELTISTFSHCPNRRVDLFAILFFFDYLLFPPSPLLLTPALGGQFMPQSLPNITASHQAHRAVGEPCSIRVLWKKAGVLPGVLRALAAVFIPGTRFMKAPLKQTQSLRAKKTRTAQRTS